MGGINIKSVARVRLCVWQFHIGDTSGMLTPLCKGKEACCLLVWLLSVKARNDFKQDLFSSIIGEAQTTCGDN